MSGVVILAGCRAPGATPQPWTWPGANQFNTLHFSRSGTEPRPKLAYVKMWDAERFPMPNLEQVPCFGAAAHSPLTCDLDGDGSLEIVPEPLQGPPALILNCEGLPVAGVNRRGLPWAALEAESIRVIAGSEDTVTWTSVSGVVPESMDIGSGIRVVVFNHTPLALQTSLVPGRPYYSRRLAVWDCVGPRKMWDYQFGPEPFLQATCDLNGDQREELLFTTYGEENGASANGTRDYDSCYCVCLDEGGKLLWRSAFGAYHFSGSRACVADINSDTRPEVVLACHTWQNHFGGLRVLDGATGVVIAETPGPDSIPVSYVSAGCADLEPDGRTEIVATVSGPKAEVLVYRMERGRLRLLARRAIGTGSDSSTTFNCRLDGLCDLDGDRSTELLVSCSRQMLVCPDPVFYPSKFDSCRLLILNPELGSRQEIGLPERCLGLTLGDIIPGGNIEILVQSDRLALYSTDRSPY